MHTLFLFLEAFINKQVLHMRRILVLDTKEQNTGFCYWHLSSNFLMTNLQAIFVVACFLSLAGVLFAEDFKSVAFKLYQRSLFSVPMQCQFLQQHWEKSERLLQVLQQQPNCP